MLNVQIRFRSDDPHEWQALRPGEKEVVALESDFPAYLRFEGRASSEIHQRRLRGTGTFVAASAMEGVYAWHPFEHAGYVAYGFISLVVDVPGGGEYFVDVRPSRLSQNLWSTLFEQVCAAADALVTQWQESRNPRLRSEWNSPRTRFSASVAAAELDRSWKTLEGALRRIARRPRMEIGPPHPARMRCDPDILPEPSHTTDTYENRVVAMTTRKLTSVLSIIAQRADRSYREEAERCKILRGATPQALEDAARRLEQARALAKKSRERLDVMGRLARDLPVAGPVHVQAPHATPRVRMHPDYQTVLQFHRRIGHERYAVPGKELSALATRRASDIYEYWALFAICSTLVRLGFHLDFGNVARLVRDDLFELEIRRDRSIDFTSQDRSETLSIWYNRQSTFVPNNAGRQMKKQQWRQMWGAAQNLPPGFYGRKSVSPDLWFELRTMQGIAVSVGDAIFDNPTRDADDVLKKAAKVEEYRSDLMIVDEQRKPRLVESKGLVVFCGDDESLRTVEEESDHDHVVFLALVPQERDEKAMPEPIPVADSAVETLKAFVEDMRAHVVR